MNGLMRILKKKFPMSYKYLPLVKFVSLLLLFKTISVDYQTYSRFLSTILLEESPIPASPDYYSYYAACLCFSIIVYEYVLSIYVILKAK